MNEDEVRAYYDIPENAKAMCDLLMRTHSGWTVWRVRLDRTPCTEPVWCARHETWPANCPSLVDETAGMLNFAIIMVESGAVTVS
ncbi:hypothetical protein ACFOY2_01155 [Nonomuraea purpurea]|uniref:Uncharacterized protein n=1 Tax=Nonomuraea purpurea TaxID=1849276 RepID=A0ABV8FVR1_9ACTN